MTNRRQLSHKEVEQHLTAYRELTAEERRAVEAHLANCQDCARLAEEYRQVDALLKQTAWKRPKPQMAAEFHETIERNGRSWMQLGRQLGGQLAGIAVLALVVISTWLVLRNGLNQAPIESPTATLAATSAPVPTLEPGETLTFRYTLTETVDLFALSPEGSYLATVNDNELKIWDAGTGKLMHVIKDEPFTIESMAFTPNGVNLLARDTTGQFHRWLAFNAAYQRTFSGAESEIGTPFVLGNTTLALVTAENNLELWPLLGSHPKRTLQTNGLSILSLAITPDSQSIAAYSENRAIAIWNQYGDLAAGFSTNQRYMNGLTLSNDSKLITAFSDNHFQLWQDYTLRFELPPERFPTSGIINSARFVSENNYLMITYQQGLIQIWDVNSGELVKSFESNSAVQDALAFTRNGFLYATLDAQGQLTIWEKPEYEE